MGLGVRVQAGRLSPKLFKMLRQGFLEVVMSPGNDPHCPMQDQYIFDDI